jgi:PAS domain S-box-containing protein
MAAGETTHSKPSVGDRNEMAARIEAFDWSGTTLGPQAKWPDTLRIAVDLCLSSRFPMHVWWGADQINIYNDAHVPLLGRRHPDALGRPARDVWTDAWPVISSQVDAVMQRGQSIWNHRVHVPLERNGQREDAWFTWSYSPLRDLSGNIVGLICIATEDTAQVLAEQQRDRLEAERQSQRDEEKARADEELRNSTTLLRGISDSTGDVIFAKDRDGRLRFANPATLALVGKPLDQVIRKTDLQILDDADAARTVMANERRIIESGIGENLEEIVPLPDGRRRVWFSQKMPYRDAEGKIIGLLGISRDITDLKAVEEESQRAKEAAESANKAKDHLLAVVSHELRTPLNPILAITSYLETRADLPADLREDMAVIRRNVEQEARIVDDLLSVTRLHRGKIVLHHETVDLHAMLLAVIKQFSPQAQARHIDVQSSLQARQHHVWADPARLQQVLSNLFDNAVKFTPEGGRITVATSTATDGRMRVEITDTGIGIEPELLPKLFKPFEQGEKTITRRFGGFGLGLVIVKGIVDLHQGSINATSPGRDKGTTVTLELEAMQPVAAPIAPASARPEADRKPGLRVLLVEDHHDTLQIMRRVLISLGYVVLTATTVKEATALLVAEPVDLLLSDIGLPDGSGLEIMQAIRMRNDIKGIALSGFGHDEDIRRSREAGFTEHLIKPVDFHILDTTLKRVAG